MNTSVILRRALLGAFLIASAATAGATVIYEETFGNSTVAGQLGDLTPNFTAGGVSYSDHSTSVQASIGLQRNWRTNQNASYTFPNIAPDAHLAITRVGGGLAVGGIDTSGVFGQNLTLSVSVLLGYATDASGSSSGLYPYTDGTETVRTMTADLNDYVRFEVSYDQGANWNTVTLNMTVAPVDASRPWTEWSVDLGSVSGTVLEFRFQDTGVLASTPAYVDNVNEDYSSPIRIDSLNIVASSVVPEPSAFALGAGSAAMAFGLVRRRKRRQLVHPNARHSSP